MMQPDDLMLASGMLSLALWTLAYLLIIRRGQLDRTYGMPFVALCPNLAYELTYGLIEPNVPPLHIVNIVWFVVDLVIAAQYLRFGRRELSPLVPGWLFVPRFLLITGLWVLAALALTRDLGLQVGNSYLGWGCQIILGGAYLFMLTSRPGVEGQSLYIALARFLGSLAVIPAQEVEAPGLKVIWTMYATFVILDITYITLYIRRCRMIGIDPWRRV